MLKRIVAGKYVRVLKQGDQAEPEALRDAKTQLLQAGPDVVSSIIELLSHTESRKHALEVLEKVLTTSNVEPFVEALSSEQQTISHAVTDLLSSSTTYDPSRLLAFMERGGRTRALLEPILTARIRDVPPKALVDALTGGTMENRTTYFRLLEARPDPAIAKDLMHLLVHDDWWFRMHALKLLGGLESLSDVSTVEARLQDENKHVRLEAVKTLGRLASHDSIPVLCNSIRDSDLKVHTAAIEVLIALNDDSAVPHLLEVLKDDSEQARRGAVEVLNEVVTPEAVGDLAKALSDEDWWVRVRSADALATLGGDRVVEAILDLVDHDDVNIRRCAIEILNSLPDERAVDKLIGALEDSDWWVRERAIDALGNVKSDRAVEPLIDLMDRDLDVAALCVKALAKLGDERAIPAICGMTMSNRSDLKRESCDALRALLASELSPESREAAQRALRGAGSPVAAAGRLGRPLDVQAQKTPSRPDPSVVRSRPTSLGSSGARPSTPPPPMEPATPAPAEPKRALIRSDNLVTGDMLVDRYRVAKKIGGGGFGHVYLVEDKTVGERLILKILSPHISADETMIRRFVDELKYTRRISHPNVIRLYDFIEIDGAHAISMEYFKSADLGVVVRESGALPVDRTLYIAEQVCAGLAAAHEQDIVHRDIKPPNILVGDGDEVKIVDFGLAAVTQRVGSRITKSGILIGTPQYMAPEQITGGDIDHRTDIYSLGTVIYEMLTGSPPIKGDNAVNILFQHLEGEVPRLSEVVENIPQPLSDLVEKAMSREVDDRPQSAIELLEAIQSIQKAA